MKTHKKTFAINKGYNWGDKWFNFPCSDSYMQKMCTIFENYQTTNNKNELYKFYLTEFKNEFERISNNNVLLSLLKIVIPDDDSDLAKVVYKKINQRKVRLPNSITSIVFETKTKLYLIMNNAWSFSFRIHNANTLVEPNLKIDVQLEGVPSAIHYINAEW